MSPDSPWEVLGSSLLNTYRTSAGHGRKQGGSICRKNVHRRHPMLYNTTSTRPRVLIGLARKTGMCGGSTVPHHVAFTQRLHRLSCAQETRTVAIFIQKGSTATDTLDIGIQDAHRFTSNMYVHIPSAPRPNVIHRRCKWKD